jgi:hypothetical protein
MEGDDENYMFDKEAHYIMKFSPYIHVLNLHAVVLNEYKTGE